MRLAALLLAAAAGVSAAVLPVPAGALYRPCSGAQVLAQKDNPRAQQCLNQGTQDIINNRPVHYLMCINGEVHCCVPTSETTSSCPYQVARPVTPLPVTPRPPAVNNGAPGIQ